MTDTALPALPCYLNGEFTTLPEAKVSVLDRGFIFGDGVYEVVPVYGGRPFHLDEHLARLERSLAAVRIANPLAPAQWRALVRQLTDAHAQSLDTSAGAVEQLVYLQVTRGVALRDHAIPRDIAPTVFAMANRLQPVPPGEREAGVRCVSADDFRWEKAHIKSTSLLGAVLSRQISADVGAAETLMFRGGFLSEAAASNVWVVRDGVVSGPPRDNLVLEGIRYGVIEQLCAASDIGFALRPIARAEVFEADELLLSSATKEVLAITRLDEQPIGNGRPGPIYHRLYALYQRAKYPDLS